MLVIERILVGKMAVFCYMAGDTETKTCALVDPAFETDRILETAASAGFKVTHVINTHGHADHVCGNRAVVAATGAKVCIHREDAGKLRHPVYRVMARGVGGKGSPPADRLLSDGDVIGIGESRLLVLHTPGHSPGSVCLLAPGKVLTGDTLFVGGVGTTAFPGGNLPQLMASIKERLYALPEDTVVLPGHHYGESPETTIGREKATNPFTR
jgi:glyoxylase-like metal-dependent hydrolase (beta-lactamase superfamily II)